MTALAVLLLFLENIAPTGRLGFYALSAFLTAVVIIECGIYHTFAFYVASSLLALLILPNKLEVLPYILFLGVYGIVKYYAEKPKSRILEFIIKLLFFNGMIFVFYLFLKTFIFELMAEILPWTSVLADVPGYVWIAVFLAGQGLFIFFDYVYTLFIRWYIAKVRKHLSGT